MAKKTTKAAASPKAPVSTRTRKGAVKTDAPAASPSAKKTKQVVEKKVVKKQEPKEKAPGPVVPSKVAAKAIAELIKYNKNEKKPAEKASLFDDEDDAVAENTFYVQINTKKFYSDRGNFKPKLIQVTNAIHNQDTVKSCLIIRDQLVTTNEQLESLENENLPTVSQIIPIKTLKTEYKPFEKRRQLYQEYDLFIVDDAVLNLMPSLLGKAFYDNGAKKAALPVRVTASKNMKELSFVTLKNQLNKVLSSTSFLPPMGDNVVVKIGSITSTFDEEKLAQNLQDVVASFEADSIKSILLKTGKSPSLPLYYAEKLYDEADIAENVEQQDKTDSDGLTAFERGLLELGAAEEVSKVIGKKADKENKYKVHKK